MTTRLDHLLFTWAWKGVTGQPGFQPVAATGRFADTRTPVSVRAAALCQYVRPPGLDDPADAPVSFGWTTVGGVRLVFRRSYLGKDPEGRPGNFCAHLVAGPLDELPISEVSTWAGSPHWWQGEELQDYLGSWDGALPGFLTGANPGAAPASQLGSFSEAMFHARGRAPVVLCGHAPERTVSLVSELAGRLGGVMERIAVSTYEGPESCGDFDVVDIGKDGAMPAGAVEVGRLSGSRHARRCRQLVLSDEQTDRDAVSFAVANVLAERERERANLGLFVRHLVVFDQVSGGNPVSPSLVPAVFSRPGAAARLLGMAAGLQSVVRALASGHEPSWESTGKTVPHLDGRLSDALAEGLGAELGRRTAPDDLPALLDRVHAAPQGFRDRCLETFLMKAESIRLAGLGLEDRVRLLSFAPPSSVEHRVAETLLSRPASLTLPLADRTELPQEWRGRALALHIRHLPNNSRKSLKPTVDRLLGEPALATETARCLPSADAMIEILDQLAVEQVPPIALAAAAGMDEDHCSEMLDQLLTRLRVRTRPYLLADVAAVSPKVFAKGFWDRTVSDAVGDAVEAILPEASASMLPTREFVPLLRLVSGDCCALWLAILDQRDGDPNGIRSFSRPKFDAALEAAGTMTEPRHRRAAQELAVALCLRDRPALRELRIVAARLGHHLHLDEPESALYLVRTVSAHPGLSETLVVYHLADLVATGRLELNRKWQIRHGKLQRASETALRNLYHNGGITDARRLTVGLGGRALAWFDASCTR